jgi:hypothetical protein
MSAKLRIGAAGAGLIGRRHIELIAASADCLLARIADPSPAAGLRVSPGPLMEQAA